MRRLLPIAALALASLASCAPVAPARDATTAARADAPPVAREAKDEPFRARPPELAPPTSFTPPPIRALRLSNGVPVLFFESHDTPLVHVGVVLSKGAGAFGAASVLPSAMLLGSSHHAGPELNAARDAALAQSGAWAHATALGVHYTAPSSNAETIVALLADVTLHACLPPSSVIRFLQNDAERRRSSDDVPKATAARLLPMALYGWTRPEDAFGGLRAVDVELLSPMDVSAAYEHTLDPSAATIVVVGDTTEGAIVPILEKHFGPWRGRGKRVAAPPTAARLAGGPRVVVVDRPRSPESYALFGAALPAFGSPDWSASLVMNAILGGGEGRVARALVDERHLTWGWSTWVTPSPGASRIALGASLPAAQTAEGMRAIDHELRALRAEGPTAEELAQSRDRLVRAAPAWLATIEEEADVVEGVVIQGVPPDDPSKRAARLAAVGAADVRRVATEHLDPDRMKIVVVGDWSAIRDQVLALGWGPIEVRDATGKVLRVEGRP